MRLDSPEKCANRTRCVLQEKKRKKEKKKAKLRNWSRNNLLRMELGNIAVNEKRKALDLFDADKNQIRKRKREGFPVKIWKESKKKKKENREPWLSEWINFATKTCFSFSPPSIKIIDDKKQTACFTRYSGRSVVLSADYIQSLIIRMPKKGHADAIFVKAVQEIKIWTDRKFAYNFISSIYVSDGKTFVRLKINSDN